MRQRNPRRVGPKKKTRAKCEHIEGAKVRFHFPCGHYRTDELNQPKPGGGTQPMHMMMVRMLVRSWETTGVNVDPCYTCKYKADSNKEAS